MDKWIITKAISTLPLLPSMKMEDFSGFVENSKGAKIVECETGGNDSLILVSYSEREETNEEYNTRLTAMDNDKKALLKKNITKANADIKEWNLELEELKEVYR